MLFGGLQVLTDGDHIHHILPKIFKRLNDFFLLFSKAQHDSTFCAHSSFFQYAEGFHTLMIFCLYAHLLRQPFRGFYVMTHYFRTGIDDSLNIFSFCFKIGDKGFKGSVGIQ